MKPRSPSCRMQLNPAKWRLPMTFWVILPTTFAMFLVSLTLTMTLIVNFLVDVSLQEVRQRWGVCLSTRKLSEKKSTWFFTKRFSQCGRAVPLLWQVLNHGSAIVAFTQQKGMLGKARWLLCAHGDVRMQSNAQIWLQLSCYSLCDNPRYGSTNSRVLDMVLPTQTQVRITQAFLVQNSDYRKV